MIWAVLLSILLLIKPSMLIDINGKNIMLFESFFRVINPIYKVMIIFKVSCDWDEVYLHLIDNENDGIDYL